MTNNPVVWFEIYVQEMDRARKFYEGTLGVKLESLPMPEGPGMDGIQMFAFPNDMSQTGASGALVKMDGAPSGGNGTLIYFACEDCSVQEARVVAQGGKVCKSKMPIGQYGFIAIITDTEGNVIGLHSMK